MTGGIIKKKENSNLAVQLFWQSLSLKHAKEHSTLAANTTQIFPVLALSAAAENGINTTPHTEEISGGLTTSELLLL